MDLQRVGNEIILNATGAGFQSYAQTVVLTNGRLLSTWMSTDPGDGSLSCIRARSYAPDSPNGVYTDFVVNTSAAGYQRSPQAVALADGAALVLWSSEDGGDGSGSCIRARMLSGQGTPADFVVNTTAWGDQVQVEAVALPDGRVLVTWRSADGGDGAGLCIRGRVIDPATGQGPPDFVVNTTGAGDQAEPIVRALGDGRLVFTWYSDDGGDGDGICVRARIVDPATGVGSPDFVVNTTGSSFQSQSDVLALPDGRLFFTWSSGDGADGSRCCVRARLYDPNDPAASSDFVIRAESGGYEHAPEAALLPDGRVVVAWTSQDPGDGSGSGVRACLYDPATGARSPTVLVNATTVADQFAPEITVLPDNRVMITFTSADGGDGGANCIRAAFFDPRGLGVTWTGTDDHDVYVGTDGDDRLDGLGGSDHLDGGGGDDLLIGGLGPNLLNGGDGNDTLDGALGEDDWDVLAGGMGDDTYVIHHRLSYGEVVEAAGEGRDVIVFEGDELYLNDAEVEVAIASAGAEAGLIRGNDVANRLVGNASDNQLVGEGGDDTLVAGSGTDVLAGNEGDDVLVGGAVGSLAQMQGGVGDDTYVVGAGFCRVQEAEGEGTADRVRASASFTLASGSHVEIITTTDNRGTDAIDLIGNEFANVIVGNFGSNHLVGGDGDDTLDGGISGGDAIEGGEGNDLLVARDGFRNHLAGQAGDDRYLIAGGNDSIVFEAQGEGRDVVLVGAEAFVAYDDAEIESIVALAGAEVSQLIGNGFNNRIVGNAGDNYLDGRDGDDTLLGGSGLDILGGGEGADLLVGGGAGSAARMAGGTGSDTYLIGRGSCSIDERDGEGVADKIMASESFTLEADVAVEILTAADRSSTRGIDLHGNEFANLVVGDAGGNTLSGGLGADRLIGGEGRDTFVFDAALGAGNVDRIGDYRSNHDRIELDGTIFTTVGPAGQLSADAFVVGARAQDAEDRIIYNAANGALLYDADGSGTIAAVRFATLAPGLSDLSHTAFLVA